MRILLTGFEAWRGRKNPSGMVAQELDGKVIDGARIIGKVLPEDFYALPKLAKELVVDLKPSAVISTGWDYTRAIKVEKVALNVMNSYFADSTVPDNTGNKPRGEPIIKNGPLALQSTLPVEEIVRVLKRNKIPATLSYHAGTHCCNTAMYSFLYANKVLASGFIHVPPLPEMVQDKVLNTIVMPINLQKKAIELAIRVSAKHLSTREKSKTEKLVR